MTLNKLLTDQAVAVQTAKGTAAAAPAYVFPLKDGIAASFESKDTVDQETGQNYATAAYREEVAIGADCSLRAYPAVLGLLLYAALGADAVTGEIAPYTHDFTVADTTPWLTLFPKTDTDFVKITDAKVDTLKIGWSKNEPLLVEAAFAGLSYAKLSSRPSGGVDVSGTNYITPANGVFKVAGAGTSPVAVDITAFSLEIARGLSGVFCSGSPLPKSISMGRASFKPSITVMPENDLNLFWEIATGSALGTAPSTVTVKGSFEVTVQIDASTSLTISADYVPWKCEYPGADPAGGEIELSLTADDILGTASASPVSIQLKNAVEEY